MASAPHVPPTRRSRLGAAATALALAGALLGGCADLRLETPPPPTPTPDAREQVRDRTARDATDLADLATRAALTAPEAVATVLGRVADVGVTHADAFGGVYVPFPDATPAPTATPTATAEPVEPTVADVQAALAQAAAVARADAETVADGDLARLLAAVWVSRTLLAGALDDAVAAAAGAQEGGGDAEEPPAPEGPAITGVPAGLDADAVDALVASEDAAGFAWEVVAARSSGEDRSRAAARARVHRDLAEAWAEAAGTDRTEQDPRRAAYALPEALTAADTTAEAMAAVTAEIEAALAATYASLVADADAGARGPLLDALLAQVTRAVSGPVPAFPAVPERA